MMDTLATKNAANAVFLGVTMIAVIAPIFLAVPQQKKQAVASQATSYSISIPYNDPSIKAKEGARKWGDRLECEVSIVPAPDRLTAVTKALADFKASGRSSQLFEKGTVTIDHERIVAEAIK